MNSWIKLNKNKTHYLYKFYEYNAIKKKVYTRWKLLTDLKSYEIKDLQVRFTNVLKVFPSDFTKQIHKSIANIQLTTQDFIVNSNGVDKSK